MSCNINSTRALTLRASQKIVCRRCDNMAYYGKPKKKVIRKRSCTIIVIPKKRSASRRSRSASRGRRY